VTCTEVLGDEFACQLVAGHWGSHVHQTEGARISWDQIRPFDEAEPGDECYLWKPEKGSTEYAFWTDADGITDGADDLVTVTKQRWRLIAERKETWVPHHQLCPACHGDEEAADGTKWEWPFHPDDGRCTVCNATGQHPDAGTWITTTVAPRGTVPHEQPQPPPPQHPHPTPRKKEP
jgi:hypothetical protein